MRQTGHVGTLRAGLTAGAFSVDAGGNVDIRERFLRDTAIADTRVVVDAAAKRRFSPATFIGLGISADSDLREQGRVLLRVGADTADPLGGSAEAGATFDGHPFGACSLAVGLGANVRLSASLASAYHAPFDDIEFLHLDTVVRCSGTGHRSTVAHARVAYRDTLLFPVRAECWIDYNSSPLWLSAARTTDPTVALAEQPSPFGSLTTAGARVQYAARWPVADVGVFAEGRIVLEGETEQLSVPWRCGAEAGVHAARHPDLSAVVMLEAVGPVTQSYLLLPSRTIEEHEAGTRVDLSVHVRVPVLSPVLRRRVRAHVEVRCGPVSLTGGNRVLQHPQGSLFGPQIEFRCRAALLGRT
jgi:hypothetical protein